MKKVLFCSAAAISAGAVAVPLTALVFALPLSALLTATKDPTAHVTAAAVLCAGLGGLGGGILSVKLTGALINGVFSGAAATLLILLCSAFVPDTAPAAARVLVPIAVMLFSFFGGYLASEKKQKRNDVIKKAIKKRRI